MPVDLSILSCDESDEESSDGESLNDGYKDIRHADSNDGLFGLTEENALDDLWSRCIVHLDVDCFYCQCEELDGPPDYKDRPLAIGQKHIIVTSNYVARRAGVKKLQSRTEAKRLCPNLLILEGSDLERYRQHSRRIYNTFRQTLHVIGNEVATNGHPLQIPACKGGFDEMFADMTALVNVLIQKGTNMTLPSNTYVYGRSPINGHTVCITEDQSGATSTVRSSSQEATSPTYSGHIGGSETQRRECERRLHIAGVLAERVRRSVREQTGFTTSIGVSVSPMLAKLTSDLKKPNSLNVLYPWNSSSILLSMPLRKVPELGHRTLSALETCLRQHHDCKPAFWNCRHLLQVPRTAIHASLKNMKSFNPSSPAQRDLLCNKCRGVDNTVIVDDEGGINKTVSVENSFRRGSIVSREAVWEAITDLFVRLPRLLDQRRSSSSKPENAFPNTIRVTVRLVDKSLQKRRPFVTKSRQSELDGKRLMNVSNMSKRGKLLQGAVLPLLEALLFNAPGKEVNVTRVNIAATNFADLPSGTKSMKTNEVHGNPSVAEMFTASQLEDSSRKRKSGDRTSPGLSDSRLRTVGSVGDPEKCPKYAGSGVGYCDPSVLAELPSHIVDEIISTGNFDRPLAMKSKPASQTTISNFFQRKKV